MPVAIHANLMPNASPDNQPDRRRIVSFLLDRVHLLYVGELVCAQSQTILYLTEEWLKAHDSDSSHRFDDFTPNL